MERYERTMTAVEMAQYVLDHCFFITDKTTYINYRYIYYMYYVCHLVCCKQQELTPLYPYRHITPEDIHFIYLSYLSITEGTYDLVTTDEGKLIAVSQKQEIPQYIFSIVTECINLLRD